MEPGEIDETAANELLGAIHASIMNATARINPETPPCVSFDAR
jgi:hypothetical protein